MLNLIIVYANDTWLRSPAFLERARCLTEFILPDLKEHYSSLTADAITEIKQFPCIFAYEKSQKKDALMGYIKNIEIRQTNVRIDYELTGEIIAFEDFVQLSDLLDMGSWEWNRTHWTLKKVSLEDIRPYFISNKKSYENGKGKNREYNIALSFAGEDREYAEKIAYGLEECGVKVFYDKFKAAELWGKDLYQYLNNIYKNEADYCIIFISESYKEKAWTQHELASAQSRAFLDDKEYILPIYIDMVSIPGINETTAHISKAEYTIPQIIDMILKKLDFIDKDWLQCDNLRNLLEYAIKKIYKISKADYNQIALSTVSQQHSTNLFVVADIIAKGKYRYNLITMWGVIGQCFRTGEMIYIKDVSNCDYYVDAVKETCAEFVTPIKVDGNVVGVINIESDKKDFLDQEQINLLNNVSRDLGIMLKKIGYEIQFIEDLPIIYINI